MVKIKMHLEGLLECATIASAKELKSHDFLLVMNNFNMSWGGNNLLYCMSQSKFLKMSSCHLSA